MIKRMLVAVLTALLVSLGVIFPNEVANSVVNLFIPSAQAQSMNTVWVTSPNQFNCNWSCVCPPVPPIHSLATVEALRPSPEHFSSDRSKQRSV